MTTMTELIDLLNRGLSDRYHVFAEIGKGGMATVFRAGDLRHDRIVAVKVPHPELVSIVDSERFLREIQIAASLRHPHILPLLDSGEVEGIPFYAMPYVEGESLRERLTREKQLPIEEVVQIGREVTDALSYAHARGIVHRDIKPANIMLDSGHAVVADFGIALAAQHFTTDRLTASGMAPGSPHYMSPEQAAGESDLDGRSDIYSLACALFESLSGDPPFTGRLPQAILAKKLREPPPGLRVVRNSVPEALELVLAKALARSPADRFRTAEEFRGELQAVAEGRPVKTGPAPVSAGRGQDGQPLFKWAGLAVLAAMISFVLLTTIGFLTTRVYDVKLKIPAEFSPTRWDFPVVGLQALVPELYWGFWLVLGFVAISYVWRLISYGIHRAPVIGDTFDSWQSTSSELWRRTWTSLSPTTVADVFFFAAFLSGVVVLIPFWDLLATMWTPGTEALSYSVRPLHKTYTFALTALIVVLLTGWRSVFKYLRRKGTLAGRVGVSRWGSLALIFLLLIVATLPWRLLWNSFHERALVDGERAYVLVETDTELVMYHPEANASFRHQKSSLVDLERMGVEGYLFEDIQTFESGEPAW